MRSEYDDLVNEDIAMMSPRSLKPVQIVNLSYTMSFQFIDQTRINYRSDLWQESLNLMAMVVKKTSRDLFKLTTKLEKEELSSRTLNSQALRYDFTINMSVMSNPPLLIDLQTFLLPFKGLLYRTSYKKLKRKPSLYLTKDMALKPPPML